MEHSTGTKGWNMKRMWPPSLLRHQASPTWDNHLSWFTLASSATSPTFTITTTHSTGPVKHSLDGQREDTDPQIHRQEGLPFRQNSFISEVKELFISNMREAWANKIDTNNAKPLWRQHLNLICWGCILMSLGLFILCWQNPRTTTWFLLNVRLVFSFQTLGWPVRGSSAWDISHSCKTRGCHVHASDMRESAILLPKSLVAFLSFFFFFFFFYLMKTDTEFVTVLFLIYVLVLGHEASEILAPWPGIKPASPSLKGEVLTTGPSGNSPKLVS